MKLMKVLIIFYLNQLKIFNHYYHTSLGSSSENPVPEIIGFTTHIRKYMRISVSSANPKNISISVLVLFSISFRIDSLIPIVLSICMVLVFTFFSI